MNVRELKEKIKDLPDDMFVACDIIEGHFLGINAVSTFNDEAVLLYRRNGTKFDSCWIVPDIKRVKSIGSITKVE